MERKSQLSERQKIYNQIDEKLNPKFPKNMLLEVTNICNHSCIFCANSKSNREKKCINQEFAKRILKEAHELGTKEVGFYSTGEPLVDKNLEIYINEAKNIGYDYTYITTNGALLTKERANSIIQSGIDSIKFSINAGTKESYRFIHGKDEFEKVYDNLKYIYEYRKENDLKYKIFISCILTKYTENEKGLVNDIFLPYVDEIVFLNCKNQCGVMYELNGNLKIDNEELREEQKICPLPFNKLHITCDGYLTACCADFQNYLAIADLNGINLKDAWSSTEFQSLRKKHLEDKLEGTLCFNCVKNLNSPIKPIIEELSTVYKDIDFDKTNEIIERIKIFEKDKV